MSWRLTNTKCSGFTTKTWEISYSFSGGKTKSGKSFHSDSRYGFVPDTEEGREVLALLIKCF
jgi:hypothetical protein